LTNSCASYYRVLQYRMAERLNLPQFENPPVVELVCGVQFEPLKMFLVPHIGLLWERFRDRFGSIRQLMPLAPVIERFDAPVDDTTNLPGDFPLHPRVWFESVDGTGLIQIQRDRFLYNWKKVKYDDQYIHYVHLIRAFKEYLSIFESFLESNSLGEIKSLQYELTYVNHIPQGQGWDSPSDIGRVFPDLNWRKGSERFLPDLEGLNAQMSFRLPENQGRLHSTIRYGVRRPNQPIIVMDLTCRGIGVERSRPEMWKWFDLAHEWIVRGFEDLTRIEIPKPIWSRKDA
jgi:uncharacterized protein (TIGR04255 family)